jgi:protein gp37
VADKSGIEWTGATWNPIVGCTHVSTGCDNCYAARMASGRLKHQPLYAGLAEAGKFTGEVRLVERRLVQPLETWRAPRMIFVNSMSDLFHEGVPDEYVARVFAVMAATPEHTYQVLTKRHGRLRSLVGTEEFASAVEDAMAEWTHATLEWPLPNVWLGVSVENQKWANIRVPALLATPAAVRWISAEPLLGPVELWKAIPSRPERLDWVVAGGESGPNARPMHPDWARSLRDQCAAAPSMPFFFKQWGEWSPLGPLYQQGDDVDEMDDAHMDAVVVEVEERKRVVQLERTGHVAEGYQPTDPRTWLMARLGKKQAGRELDGRFHDEYPYAAGLVSADG